MQISLAIPVKYAHMLINKVFKDFELDETMQLIAIHNAFFVLFNFGYKMLHERERNGTIFPMSCESNRNLYVLRILGRVTFWLSTHWKVCFIYHPSILLSIVYSLGVIEPHLNVSIGTTFSCIEDVYSDCLWHKSWFAVDEWFERKPFGCSKLYSIIQFMSNTI